MDAIVTQNLSKDYGQTQAVIDLNLTVREGEIFGFIGPNGAGKSTTIRTLINLIFPTSGFAKVLGLDCVQESRQIRERIGYLPGEVNYYEEMRVKDLLHYSAAFYRNSNSKRLGELAERFEIDLSKKIGSLSLGNKKKVGIVQALLHQPELLILDEPTSGLDPLMQKRFFDLLREANSHGTTVFFSSHVLSEVEKICDRVAIIKEGRILRVETVEALRGRQLKKVRVDFGREDHPGFTIPGISTLKSEGSMVQYLYSGEMGKLVTELAKEPIVNLWIEEPPLEEIFLHYYETKEST